MLPDSNIDILQNQNMRAQIKAQLLREPSPPGLDWDRLDAIKQDIPAQLVAWQEPPVIIKENSLTKLTGEVNFSNPDDTPRQIWGCVLFFDSGTEQQLIARTNFERPYLIDSELNEIIVPQELYY